MTMSDAGINQVQSVAGFKLSQRFRNWLLLAEFRWVLGAAGLGFGVTAIGTDLLHLNRPWLVLALLVTVGMLTAWYARAHRLDLGSILTNLWV